LGQAPEPNDVPREVLDLVAERQTARAARDFARADALREQVRAAGWLIRDTREGPELAAAPPWEPLDPGALRPRWDEPDRHEVSVVAHVTGWAEDVARALHALETHCAPEGHDYEVLLLDDGSDAATGKALEDLAKRDPVGRVRVLHLEPALGFGAAMNLGMGQATGRVLVWLDPHVEATGDLFAPLLAALDQPGVGLAGGWGVTSRSMLEFDADDGPEVDAIEGYLLAVPRALAARVEVDPACRYYRNADLDYSFAVRALDPGYRALRVAVPAVRHRHRGWYETDPTQRERASKRNYDRFLRRWRSRTDLLIRGFTGYHRHG
jgi:cysteinyl-tRNA synthetase